jgi:ribonucleoside-diphosphate reductase alpha chain
MWDNRDVYNGVAVLPYDGGTYVQAPFETCTKEVYESMIALAKNIDLSNVHEKDDNTSHTQEAACAGGTCSVE